MHITNIVKTRPFHALVDLIAQARTTAIAVSQSIFVSY